MKKYITPIALALCCATLFTGCLAISLGGGTKSETSHPTATVGQQLVDLQKAKDAGAITDAEFQVQKAKLLSK